MRLDMEPRYRFLVIDDEPEIGDLFTFFLQAVDHSVDCFQDPIKGGKFFQANHKTIDGVVLDLMMPGKDGLTLAGEFRDEDPTLAIVLVTASDVTPNLRQRMEGKVDSVLSKPCDGDDLIQTAENIAIVTIQARKRLKTLQAQHSKVC